ncbi:chaperonin 10-like protein [Hyaloscypha finlandica]|nr:chaperonin 10-like protein [Hyaloscypha finlandica]
MSKNHAVIVQKAGEAQVQETSIPKLRDDYILVKTKFVALNPTDWKHLDFLTGKGVLLGCDYAGVVEEVGSKVSKPFKKGDRISGFCHGGNVVNHEDGAFAEYITAKGDVQMKIPDNMSFEEAATLGVGVTTCGQGLYQALQLPLPTSPATQKAYVLIYGGSTATGALAIQYAKLSGLTVVTTCSSRNFEYVKSLGADAAFDYNSPSCSKDIQAWSNDSIHHALDCISEGNSPAITIPAMSTSGGIYSTLLPVPESDVRKINPNVELKHTLAYTVVGEFFKFGPQEFPAKPQDFEFGKMFWEMSKELFEQGKLKVHRISLDKYGKGFEGVLKGMNAMRKGEVSGEKLVFTV